MAFNWNLQNLLCHLQYIGKQYAKYKHPPTKHARGFLVTIFNVDFCIFDLVLRHIGYIHDLKPLLVSTYCLQLLCLIAVYTHWRIRVTNRMTDFKHICLWPFSARNVGDLKHIWYLPTISNDCDIVNTLRLKVRVYFELWAIRHVLKLHSL